MRELNYFIARSLAPAKVLLENLLILENIFWSPSDWKLACNVNEGSLNNICIIYLNTQFNRAMNNLDTYISTALSRRQIQSDA